MGELHEIQERSLSCRVTNRWTISKDGLSKTNVGLWIRHDIINTSLGSKVSTLANGTHVEKPRLAQALGLQGFSELLRWLLDGLACQSPRAPMNA